MRARRGRRDRGIEDPHATRGVRPRKGSPLVKNKRDACVIAASRPRIKDAITVGRTIRTRQVHSRQRPLGILARQVVVELGSAGDLVRKARGTEIGIRSDASWQERRGGWSISDRAILKHPEIACRIGRRHGERFRTRRAITTGNADTSAAAPAAATTSARPVILEIGHVSSNPRRSRIDHRSL